MSDQEIRDVLLTLAKSTDLSFVISPGVEGQITVDLKQVTLEDAAVNLRDYDVTPDGRRFLMLRDRTASGAGMV